MRSRPAKIWRRGLQSFHDQAIRDIEYRRCLQASRLFVWVQNHVNNGNSDDMRAAVCIRNTDEQPVSDIVLGLGTTT